MQVPGTEESRLCFVVCASAEHAVKRCARCGEHKVLVHVRDEKVLVCLAPGLQDRMTAIWQEAVRCLSCQASGPHTSVPRHLRDILASIWVLLRQLGPTV